MQIYRLCRIRQAVYLHAVLSVRQCSIRAEFIQLSAGKENACKLALCGSRIRVGENGIEVQKPLAADKGLVVRSVILYAALL